MLIQIIMNNIVFKNNFITLLRLKYLVNKTFKKVRKQGSKYKLVPLLWYENTFLIVTQLYFKVLQLLDTLQTSNSIITSLQEIYKFFALLLSQYNLIGL